MCVTPRRATVRRTIRTPANKFRFVLRRRRVYIKGLWNGASATGRLLAPPARRLLLLDHEIGDARVELGDDVALLDEEALRGRDVHGAVGACAINPVDRQKSSSLDFDTDSVPIGVCSPPVPLTERPSGLHTALALVSVPSAVRFGIFTWTDARMPVPRFDGQDVT